MAENTPNHAKSDDVSLLPVASAESASALDALMNDAIVAADPTAAAAAAEAKAKEGTLSDEATAAQRKADADKALADKQAAEKAAAETKREDHAPSLEDTVTGLEAEAKAKADAKAKEEADKMAAAAGRTETDAFDAIQLPANAKQKSGEAFETLKKLARETAATLKKERDELAAKHTATTTELEAAKAAVEAAKTATLTPEVQAELDDLRNFRLSKDVESDPALKEFSAKITKQHDAIYKKLENAGINAESIAKIKEIGGLEALDWTPVMEKLPLIAQRSIEASLLNVETIKEQRAEALEAAKAKGAAYSTERAAREVADVTETANSFLKDIPWTKEVAVPATATPEEKTALEKANAIAKESVTRLKSFLGDRTPARFAELAVGTMIAHKTAAELKTAHAVIAAHATEKAAAVKDANDKLAATTKELEKVKAELLAIRKAELPRGGQGSNIIPSAPKTGLSDLRTTGDALDAIAAELASAQND